jgi:hypothetical protein
MRLTSRFNSFLSFSNRSVHKLPDARFGRPGCAVGTRENSGRRQEVHR